MAIHRFQSILKTHQLGLGTRFKLQKMDQNLTHPNSIGKLIDPPGLRVESDNRCTFYTHRPARSPDQSKHAQKAQSICWLFTNLGCLLLLLKDIDSILAMKCKKYAQMNRSIMVHIESLSFRMWATSAS